MIITAKGMVKINYIHKVSNEKGEFKKWTFSLWIGKTGFGNSYADRYRNGVCYKEVKLPMKEYEWHGKKYYKATIYNPTFEIMDYDSPKDKKPHELWILKDFNETNGEPNWNGEEQILSDEQLNDEVDSKNNTMESLDWTNEEIK